MFALQYRDEVPTTVDEIDRTKFELYLNKFASEVQSLIAPLGSRDQPIRSCKDLFKCFSDAPDGKYSPTSVIRPHRDQRISG